VWLLTYSPRVMCGCSPIHRRLMHSHCSFSFSLFFFGDHLTLHSFYYSCYCHMRMLESMALIHQHSHAHKVFNIFTLLQSDFFFNFFSFKKYNNNRYEKRGGVKLFRTSATVSRFPLSSQDNVTFRAQRNPVPGAHRLPKHCLDENARGLRWLLH
jgi:hypothetical protein